MRAAAAGATTTPLELIGGFQRWYVSDSFTVNFPASPPIRGAQRAVPDRPDAGEWPGAQPRGLNRLYPPGATVRTPPMSRSTIEHRPRSDQVSLASSTQLAAATSVSADYVHVFNREQLMTFDENKGTRATTASTSPIVRPDTTVQAVNTFINVGTADYDALLLQVDKRWSRGISARVAYTLASASGNTSGNGAAAISFQAGSATNLDLNEGPTDFDRRHNLVLSGRALVPYTHGMTFSWVARALSGPPLSLVNNLVDIDRTTSSSDRDRRMQARGRSRRTTTSRLQQQRGARGRVLPLDTRFGWRVKSAADGHWTCRPTVQPDQPGQLRPASNNRGAPRRSLILSALLTARRRERSRLAFGTDSDVMCVWRRQAPATSLGISPARTAFPLLKGQQHSVSNRESAETQRN